MSNRLNWITCNRNLSRLTITSNYLKKCNRLQLINDYNNDYPMSGNGPGQNGPNPKRPSPKRPNFFGQNGPTFFFEEIGLICEFQEFIFQRPNTPSPPPPPLFKLFHIPVPLSKYVSVQITIVLDFWLLDNYLVYIIHSYIYLYLISHFLVRSTGADSGIFIRGINWKKITVYGEMSPISLICISAILEYRPSDWYIGIYKKKHKIAKIKNIFYPGTFAMGGFFGLH